MALYTNIKGPVNYTTVGSLTIENEVVSGFSGSNYLKTASAIDTTGFSILEICLVYDNVGNTAWRPLMGGGGITCTISNGGGVGFTYSGTTYYNWNTPPATGKVIFKFIVDINNKSVIIKWSSDNGQTYKTTTKEVDTAISVSGQFSFAYANAMSSASLYLKESYIKLDDIAWFGTSFSKVKLHNQSAITYTKVGNVSITDDGVATGFTDKTDYLTLPAFNPGTSKWKFTTKVKIYDLASTISLIDRNSSTRCFQISVASKKFKVNISNNGTSKANEVSGTYTVLTNTIYYLSFEYDGSKYYLKYSLDNINWSTDITINNSNKVYPVSSLSMGHCWYGSGTEKWNGEIYLRDTHLVVEGSSVDTWELHALEGDYVIVDDKLVWANSNIYLQSSGTQRINTNFNANQDTQVKMKVSTSTIGSNQSFFVGRNAAKVNTFAAWVLKDNSNVIFRNDYNTSQNKTTCNITANTIYNIDFDKNKFYVNDTLYTTATYGTFQCTYPIILGASTRYTASDTNYGNYLQGKIYNCQIYDNGTLVRHFVPVPTGMVIGSFTVPSNGMFDIVNQQFYANQGTGTFTYGKDE